MTERHVTLVVEIPCVIVDDAWDDRTLVDNAVDYLDAIISRSEQKNVVDWPSSPYRLKSECTVWTTETYGEDVTDFLRPGPALRVEGGWLAFLTDDDINLLTMHDEAKADD